jgi:pentatricopeptide repeat protein
MSRLVNSYGLNGMGIQAIELFHQMPSELILEETYVCVLHACSHSGLVDQARSIFSNINNKTEKIYTTMVN